MHMPRGNRECQWCRRGLEASALRNRAIRKSNQHRYDFQAITSTKAESLTWPPVRKSTHEKSSESCRSDWPTCVFSRDAVKTFNASKSVHQYIYHGCCKRFVGCGECRRTCPACRALHATGVPWWVAKVARDRWQSDSALRTAHRGAGKCLLAVDTCRTRADDLRPLAMERHRALARH